VKLAAKDFELCKHTIIKDSAMDFTKQRGFYNPCKSVKSMAILFLPLKVPPPVSMGGTCKRGGGRHLNTNKGEGRCQ
jgi:hypothetical protein